MELPVLCLIIVDDQETIGSACSPLCLGTVALLCVLACLCCCNKHRDWEEGAYFSL